jgi:hypothetical protein
MRDHTYDNRNQFNHSFVARRAFCTLKVGSAPPAGELFLSTITYLHPYSVDHIARTRISVPRSMSATTSAHTVVSDGLETDPTRWSLACMKFDTTARSVIVISTHYLQNEVGSLGRAFGIALS